MYSDTFLSADLKQAMYQGYSYEKAGINNYGLGIRIKERKKSNPLLYHFGWWHGNTATYITLRQDSVLIISLSNKYNRKIYHLNKLESVFHEVY
jgi:hypothetical protein